MMKKPESQTAEPARHWPSERRLHARPPWRKILYTKQPYPDNYTDPELFLRGLVTNARVQPKHYWKVVCDAAMVAQQASVVTIVAAVHTHCMALSGTEIPRSSTWLLSGNIVLFILLVGSLRLVNWSSPSLSKQGAAKNKPVAHQVALLVTSVWATSGLPQMLTRSISKDAHVANVVFLFMVHMFLHDYSFLLNVSDEFSCRTGLSAAVLASVLLASRLPSPSLVAFLLFPHLQRGVRCCSLVAHLTLSLLLFAFAISVLVPLSSLLVCIFITAVYFVTFVCPFFLVRIQKFKIQINGPWDEAKFKTTSSVSSLKTTSSVSSLHDLAPAPSATLLRMGKSSVATKGQ